MSFFKLFNGTNVDVLNDDDRLAFGKPNVGGSKIMTWLNFKALFATLFVRLIGDQVIDGVKTFIKSPQVPNPTNPLDAVNLRSVGEITKTFSSVEFHNDDLLTVKPYVYYKFDATEKPLIAYLPNPSATNTGEYHFELFKDTHKLTLTTEGGTAVIDGKSLVKIPTKGGTLKLKALGLDGYTIIADNRDLWNIEYITEDRSFDTDGVENNVIYAVVPTNGGTINITLPPACDCDEKVLRCVFSLIADGSAVITTTDGSLIGDKNTQVISNVDSGFTLSIFNELYHIEDNRPRVLQNATVNFFSLQETSDISGYRKLVTSKEDADYSPLTIEEVSADITSETMSVFRSYAATEIDTPLLIEKGNITFNVNCRKTSSVQANVIAKYEIYKRDAQGVETKLNESPIFTISLNTYQNFIVNIPINELSFEATERLVMKELLAKTSGSGTPTLTTKFEGSEPAYFSTMVNAANITLNAISVSYDNSESTLNADNVQGALTELDGKKEPLVDWDERRDWLFADFVGFNDYIEINSTQLIEPFKYYRVTGLSENITLNLPNPTAGDTSEYFINTKGLNGSSVTIKTLGDIAGAIDGQVSIQLFHEDAYVMIKSDGANGYKILQKNVNNQTSNNFYVKNNIEFNQVLQLEGFDIINIFLTENLSFEFDSILNISARRINIYNDVKININNDITFNFSNSQNTSISVFSHITTFKDRTITILSLYNNIFNNFYFNGVNCDTALSNGQLTFLADDYIEPYKSVININSLHNIDLVYSTTNVTLNIIDWDRNTTDKIKILRKVSESLYYSNNTRMFAVLETGKLYQYISEASTYTIDNINVLATKHGGDTRFVALETVQQNAEILTITDANVSTYVGIGVGAITDMIINVPINTKIISIETTTKQKVNGVQFDHQPMNGQRVTITGNIEYATGEGYNSTDGRFSRYLYSYLTSTSGSGAISSVEAFYDFLYWNGVMYTEGY